MMKITRKHLANTLKEYNLELIDFELLYGSSFEIPDYIKIKVKDKMGRELSHELEYTGNLANFLRETIYLQNQKQDEKIIKKFSELEDKEISVNEFMFFLMEEGASQVVTGEKGELKIDFLIDDNKITMFTAHGDIYKVILTSNHLTKELEFY